MIERDTILVCDRGNYLFLAQKLGEKARKVYYCLPDTRPYPETRLAQIGCDLPEIERIEGDEKWKVLKHCDWAYFPDCYDGEFQRYLIDEGIPVAGAIGSSRMELDRIFFLDLLKKLSLPVARTYRAEGLDDLLSYLERSSGVKFIKGSKRGDFETKRFSSMLQIRPWANSLKGRLGEMSEEIDILVQDEIKSDCEVGSDDFNVNGKTVRPVLVGYEIKDKGYLGCIMPALPKILQDLSDKLAPTFKELGCQGNFSTELRITKDGKAYFTDSTNRVPKPPGHVMCEAYTNWPQMIRDLAHGIVPKPQFKHRYVAEYILHSSDHEHGEVFVRFPKDCEKYVKLCNHTAEGDGYYIIENGNGGYFGGCIGTGNTKQEAINSVKEVMGEIEADGLDYEPSVFDEADKAIAAGRKYGIQM